MLHVMQMTVMLMRVGIYFCEPFKVNHLLTLAYSQMPVRYMYCMLYRLTFLYHQSAR